jgi:hypothetical protein
MADSDGRGGVDYVDLGIEIRQVFAKDLKALGFDALIPYNKRESPKSLKSVNDDESATRYPLLMSKKGIRACANRALSWSF